MDYGFDLKPNEYEKDWLVTEIVSGRLNYRDYLDGKVKYCEKCKVWEYKGSLTYCILQDAMDKISKNGLSESQHHLDAINYIYQNNILKSE